MLLTFDPTRPKHIEQSNTSEPPTTDQLRAAVRNTLRGLLDVLDHLEANEVESLGSHREIEVTDLFTTASRLQVRELRQLVTLAKLYGQRDVWVAGGKARAAEQLICEIASGALTREDQSAIGFRLVAIAAEKDRRGESPDQAEAARVLAAQQLIAAIDPADRQYAIDFVPPPPSTPMIQSLCVKRSRVTCDRCSA